MAQHKAVFLLRQTMQNVKAHHLEAVFLLGILSAKTGKVLSDEPIGNEEFVPCFLHFL